MHKHTDKKLWFQAEPISKPLTQEQEGRQAAPRLVDNRPEAAVQGQMQVGMNNSARVWQRKAYQAMANHSPQVKQAAHWQEMADQHNVQAPQPIQKRANRTGLPDTLKSGVENLSGYAMDDVRVHYNSPKPAQLQAHAYAQGTEIHLAPGQEKHLAHEAWHVVQQKQGRVKPTLQMKSGVHINNDDTLEREADVMGAKALQSKQKAPGRYTFADSGAQKKDDGIQGVGLVAHRHNLLVPNSSSSFSWSKTAQLTVLGDEKTPADGPDPEAPEIEWYQSNPYILDDQNTWRRVSREMVNNQRGERGEDHQVDVGQLRKGVRKAYKKEASRTFKINNQATFLKVVYNYGMVITAYYMNDNAAKRDVVGRNASDVVWGMRKNELPDVG